MWAHPPRFLFDQKQHLGWTRTGKQLLLSFGFDSSYIQDYENGYLAILWKLKLNTPPSLTIVFVETWFAEYWPICCNFEITKLPAPHSNLCRNICWQSSQCFGVCSPNHGCFHPCVLAVFTHRLHDSPQLAMNLGVTFLFLSIETFMANCGEKERMDTSLCYLYSDYIRFLEWESISNQHFTTVSIWRVDSFEFMLLTIYPILRL